MRFSLTPRPPGFTEYSAVADKFPKRVLLQGYKLADSSGLTFGEMQAFVDWLARETGFSTVQVLPTSDEDSDGGNFFAAAYLNPATFKTLAEANDPTLVTLRRLAQNQNQGGTAIRMTIPRSRNRYVLAHEFAHHIEWTQNLHLSFHGRAFYRALRTCIRVARKYPG